MEWNDISPVSVTSSDFPQEQVNKLVGWNSQGPAEHYNSLPNNAGIGIRCKFNFWPIPEGATILYLNAIWHAHASVPGYRSLYSWSMYNPNTGFNFLKTNEVGLTGTGTWYDLPGFIHYPTDQASITAAIRNPNTEVDFMIVSRSPGWVRTYVTHLLVRVYWEPAKPKTSQLFFGTNF